MLTFLSMLIMLVRLRLIHIWNMCLQAATVCYTIAILLACHALLPYNLVSLYATLLLGGYLDDLWIYTKVLDFSTPGQLFRGNNGAYKLADLLFGTALLLLHPVRDNCR